MQIQSWIIKIVISFIIRQLGKFSQSLDWVKIQADLDTRIRQILPGTWFDDEICNIIQTALITVRRVLNQGDNINSILALLADQKYEESIALLNKIILKDLVLADNSTPSQAKLQELIAIV